MGPYKQPLDASRKEIRRLILQPLSAGPEIQCSTEAVSLLDKPDYEALSYVWGDASIRKNIVFNGNELSVTSNLAVALYHLRHQNKLRRLWVDALCINQGNLKERNEQVAMMSDVYIGAKLVVIWLGEGSEETDQGFDLISIAAKKGEVTEIVSRDLFSFYFELVKIEWFTRLWTVQELVLASQDPLVVCGFKWTTWSTIVKAWKKVAQVEFGKMGMLLPKTPGESHQGSEETYDIRPNGIRIDLLENMCKAIRETGGHELRDLLLNTISVNATEPKDRIYGLLGMMLAEDRDCFVVDYGKSLATVYTEAIALIFRKGQGPLTLSGMHLVGSSQGVSVLGLYPSFPSWVPTFGNKLLLTSLTFHPPGIGASGAGSNAINGEVDPDLQTLRIRGLHVDKIIEDLSLGKGQSCLDQLNQIEDLVDKAHQLAASNTHNRPYLCNFRTKEPIWRVLIANKRYASATRDEAPESYAELYKTLLLNQNGNEFSKMKENDPAREYRLALMNHLPSNRFFITATGFYGIGQGSIEAGDQVAIWFGSPVPFVLRPTAEWDECGKPIYTVSGVAYIAGIMDGEMVDEVYCEDLEDDVVFTVR
ncbi:heterokaryon incompatibility protein-domain-containing protein [Tricladium varicosporioides]|nr:heterokaryon incompatibility protein-domain-containing protein [Hymenoscyphus varicosporioides]